MKKIALVTTTIYKPNMLEVCCENAKKYRHKEIEFFVVGDKKTPTDVLGYCNKLSSIYDLPIHYLNIKDQEKKLKDYPDLLKMIPYNDACRKLYGMVIAYIEGFDILIMLDDDNYPTDHDFFTHHGIVGTTQDIPLIKSPTGWFNTCEYLIEKNNIPFYYRGFPWSQRKTEKTQKRILHEKLKITVNGGFWLDDPDVDATTRLFWPVRAIGMDKNMTSSFGLYPGTWCPFNNQNTSMMREVLPAYYTPYTALRFSDLFPAYVICCIAEHLKHVISFGYPFVKQLRNPHNLWEDLKKEIVGAQAAETLIEMLRSADLNGKNYHECLGELNDHFEKERKIIKKLPVDQYRMLTLFIRDLKKYHEIFNSIHDQINK